MSHPRRPRLLSRLTLGLALWASPWGAGTVRLDPGSGPGEVSTHPGPIRFEDRQASSGIDFVLDNGTTPDKPVIDGVLGGLALLDYDNDGRLDVFFTNGARIPGLLKDEPRFWNRLYRNEGRGVFRDVTERAGVRGEGYSMGASA
ncbi:MAG TPA: VCBS repeat-containing protein, partial [Vicinamibacteria bacterium]